jgi:hypothetical protein
MDLHLPGHCYQEPGPPQPQGGLPTESYRVQGSALRRPHIPLSRSRASGTSSTTPRPPNPAPSTRSPGCRNWSPKRRPPECCRHLRAGRLQAQAHVSPSISGCAGTTLAAWADKQNNIIRSQLPAQVRRCSRGCQHGSAPALWRRSSRANFGPQLGFAWSPELLPPDGGFARRRRHQLRREPDRHPPLGRRERAGSAISFSDPRRPSVLRFCTTLRRTSTRRSAIPPIPRHHHLQLQQHPDQTAVVSVDAFDTNQKTMTVYHYSLDTEMQLPDNFVATLGYQGSSGHHLFYEQDLNAVCGCSRLCSQSRS